MGVDGKHTGGRADKGGWADEWNGRRVDGGGRCRTDFPKGKTPQLTRQLTWPLEIQRGRPRVTIQMGHLP